MNRFLPRLSYANVVSTICLFLVLGGGAWAATKLHKNSVGTPQLKNGAVTGAKVKDGSLSGAVIDAATLGKVPSAATADSAAQAGHATSADSAAHADSAASANHATSADSATRAGDATTLDGLGPDAFYAAAGIRRIDATPPYGGSAVTIYSANGLVLSASCNEGGLAGSIVLSIFASSPTVGARIDSGFVRRSGAGQEPIAAEYTIGSTPVTVWQVFGISGGGGNSGQAVGSLLYTDGERAIDVTLESRVTTGQECQLSGTATVSS